MAYRNVAVTAICLVLVCSAPLLAEDEPMRLPDDGWWMRYRMNTKEASLSGGAYEYPSKVTWSFVGTEVVDNEKCRWVEIEDMNLGERPRAVLQKLLSLEKHLRDTAQITSSHIVRHQTGLGKSQWS